ncbi:ABC transporter permease [Alkalihalobacillus sp. 1P02AB]|uniref:ABC transporter permease n=1 Tax=Alkalihalobacillus sp. 1P02AB TaxID=3132260 RepID=UPI0039A412B1
MEKMSPVMVFKQRVKSEWSYQYKLWKMMVDWTVWLYILLPLLAILGYQFYLLWQGEMEWAYYLPSFTIPFIFLLVCWSGTLRLFLLDGDLLFLRQRPEWVQMIKKYGLIYSIVLNVFSVSVIAFIIAPFMLVYQDVSVWDYTLLCSFVILFRLCLQYLNQLLELRYERWKKVLRTIGLFILTWLLFHLFHWSPLSLQVTFTVLLVPITLVFMKKRLNLTTTFFKDCLRENKERIKYTSMLVGLNGYQVNKKQRKRPVFLLANSAKIFRKRTTENITTELFIKLFIRNSQKLNGLFRITGVSTMAILIVPANWIKWVLFFIMLALLNYYMMSSWKELKGHSFFKLYPFSKHEETMEGIKRAIAYLSMPSSAVIGFVLGMVVLSPVWAVPMALLSGAMTYYLCMRQMIIF